MNKAKKLIISLLALVCFAWVFKVIVGWPLDSDLRALARQPVEVKKPISADMSLAEEAKNDPRIAVIPAWGEESDPAAGWSAWLEAGEPVWGQPEWWEDPRFVGLADYLDDRPGNITFDLSRINYPMVEGTIRYSYSFKTFPDCSLVQQQVNAYQPTPEELATLRPLVRTLTLRFAKEYLREKDIRDNLVKVARSALQEGLKIENMFLSLWTYVTINRSWRFYKTHKDIFEQKVISKRTIETLLEHPNFPDIVLMIEDKRVKEVHACLLTLALIRLEVLHYLAEHGEPPRDLAALNLDPELEPLLGWLDYSVVEGEVRCTLRRFSWEIDASPVSISVKLD